MPARLPDSPNLDQLRRRAKELLRDAQAGDSETLSRLRLKPGEAPQLSDAQFALAREHGFPSWPRLKAYIERIATARSRPFRSEVAYYNDRVHGLLSFLQAGLPESAATLRRFHPHYAAATDEAIRTASVGEAEARLVYARQHGFTSWIEFTRFLSDLASGDTVEPMREAYLAIERHDLPGVEAVLAREPGLVRAIGTNGHTLLHLATACLDHGNLSKAPGVADSGMDDGMAIILRLIELGADVNAANDRGATPLHQAGYGNVPALARLLLDAGADHAREAHGSGGTPLAFALFWGHREVAELLAEHGTTPGNLRIAAGLGDIGLLTSLFDEGGNLTPEAGRARAFHRVHSGFPVWSPSDDPQEILDEALVWAAKSNRTEAIRFLVQRGANLNADPYRGTALTWAASRGHLEATQVLLDLGAEVNHRGTFGGPGHGQGVTALHLAANNGRDDAVSLLLERGADPTLRDELHGGDAAGWAAFFGHPALAERLRAWRSP